MNAKMVHVTWKDAHATTINWSDPSEIPQDDYLVDTVGWLLPGAKKGHTVVVLNKTVEGHVGEGICIPNKMVVAKRYLSD